MMDNKNHAEKIKFRIKRIIRYSVAFVSGLTLLVLCYWAYIFYSLSPNNLFADNYIPYKVEKLDSITANKYSDIEKAYRESNFTRVIDLNTAGPLFPKDILLTGLAFLETGNLSRAISSFQVVLADADKTKSTILTDEAEYYLALAFLKNRDYDQAIELMIRIHDNPRHTHHEKFSRSYIRRVKMLKWR